MAVLEFKDVCLERSYAFRFQCDVCKSVFELTDNYDLVHYSTVNDQMAVLTYSHPAGFGDHTSVLHCCSLHCLTQALSHVPFSATVSIPTGGFYHSGERGSRGKP